MFSVGRHVGRHVGHLVGHLVISNSGMSLERSEIGDSKRVDLL